MRLAYSSNAFTRTGLESALEQIARLGFEGVEILCERPHWYPPEVTEAQVKSIVALLDRLGLKVSNLNANTANSYFKPAPPENVFEPSLTNADPLLRRWREEFTCAALRLAKKVGSPCLSLTSGRPTPGCPPQQALDYFTDSLKRICAYAESAGVRVGIEYEPGLLVENAEEVCEIIRRVGSPWLGVNFDIGHSFLNREPPEETVRLLQGRIWNAHVEDIKGLKHYHLVPGDGDLPFEHYFQALMGIGYDGFLTVELYTLIDQPEEAGARSLDYLSKLLRRLRTHA